MLDSPIMHSETIGLDGDSSPANDPRTKKSLIQAIFKQAPARDRAALLELFNELYADRGWSISPIANIARRFKTLGLEADLLEILWSCRSETLKDVRTAMTFIQLAGADRWDGEFFDPAFALISDKSTIANAFTENDFLVGGGQISRKAYKYLLHLKYGGFLTTAAGANIFEDARPYADAIFLDEDTSASLYANTRVKLESERAWMLERKIVNFLDHFLADSSAIEAERGVSIADSATNPHYHRGHLLHAISQSTEAAALFDRVKDSGPYLICTFHSGNYFVSQNLYNVRMSDHWTIRNRGNAQGNHILVTESRLNSAFKAIKVLMSGKCLLIAPDSNVEDSRHVSHLEIFGKTIAIPDGAARIAFEADAKMAWYTVTIEGSRYIPVFVEGPKKAAGETFESFKARFAAFYSEQVAHALSGHPRNTMLKAFFRKFLSPSASALIAGDRTNEENA